MAENTKILLIGVKNSTKSYARQSQGGPHAIIQSHRVLARPSKIHLVRFWGTSVTKTKKGPSN